jgi:hypothetical protein
MRRVTFDDKYAARFGERSSSDEDRRDRPADSR